MEIDYFNAVSKAKEAKLVSLENLEKLAKSSNLEDVAKTLLDIKLLKGEQITSYADLFSITYREESDFIEFLKKESIDADITRFFLAKYDYFNLEVLYFNKRLNTREQELTFEGNVKISTIAKSIDLKKYNDLPISMQTLLTFLDKSEDKSYFFVDTAFKKAMHKEMLNASKKSSELHECFSYYTDLKNIEIALRLRDEKMFALSKLEGGTLDDEFFKKLCKDSFLEIVRDNKYGTYKIAIELIIECLKDKKPFVKFDFLIDCFAITFFESLKYKTEQCLPYIRYCYLKLAQIKNLKIIFDGLVSNQNKKALCNQIRRVYEWEYRRVN